MTSAFKRWYDSHKDWLAKKRHEQYVNDPVYREKAKERSRVYRDSKSPRPPEYKFRFKQVAKELGITVWKLHWWRTRNYFPEPRVYGRGLWFTEGQVELLRALKTGLEEGGGDKQALDIFVSIVYSNW